MVFKVLHLACFKGYIHTVIDHSFWLLGDGANINFWTDKWLSQPIVNLLDIPQQYHNSLKAVVKDFITDFTWNIPSRLASLAPYVATKICQMTIPLLLDTDSLVWQASTDGNLTLKLDYDFL